jgi:hypothetical protein
MIMTRCCFAAFLLIACAPSSAGAQWYGAGYLGGNHTQAADVEIRQPDLNTEVIFEGVRFDARPFTSPQYYGVRIGRFVGGRRTLAIELEFIHLKVISETAGEYRMRGRLLGATVDAPTTMESVAERYSMTHGLNFVLLNVGTRRAVSEAVALTARAGAGPTYPHAESTIGGVSREQYEYAGIGVHAAAGVDLRVRGRVSIMAEYKLTAARPEMEISAGTGRVRTIDHQLAAGLAFGLTR